MNLRTRILLLLIPMIQGGLSPLFAQKNDGKSIHTPGDSTDEYYSEGFLRFENHTYKKQVRTVQFENKAAQMSSAMIRFNSDDQLHLSFDDLDAGVKNYSYTVINCNADWTPSDLSYSEYINGFTENPVRDYTYSTGLTVQKYTHYSLYLPNENLEILKPGNYLLKVYEDNADNLVLTRRFLVYENAVFVNAVFKTGSALTDFSSKQGLDFNVQYGGYDIRNPMDLKVVVLQNDRWDNALRDLKPVFLKDREADYEFTDGQNEFDGGSEFRNFDIKSIRFRSEHIGEIKHLDDGTHVFLTSDEIRARQRYSFAYDLNGRYFIKIQEGTNSDVDADYCFVHFFLPYPYEEKDANLYVFGALSNWTCNGINRMKYNIARNGYEGVLYLKQGYYNYQYVMMADGSNMADQNPIEGSHSETENEYTILIYNRPASSNYDRLIAVKKFDSTKN